ncbi:hypothetical protein MN608_03083 [Microdochium nivale]|nr:hypothetical protein MN608_03083 [Microdochium nivale]
MTVSEIAHVTLLASLPEDFVPTLKKALVIQHAWFEAHHNSTSTFRAADRGAAFFQQLENPSKILITAHWASVDEHNEWIASDSNKTAFGSIFHFLDLEKTDYFHVEDCELFSDAILSSHEKTIEITRFVVSENDRKSFQNLHSKSLATGGWRIEDDPEQPDNTAQFVVVGASNGQHGTMKERSGNKFGFAAGAEKLILGSTSKHYRRLC